MTFAAIGFVIFVLPISYFHEIGHALSCTFSGGKARISPPTITGIDPVCLHSSSNLEINRAMGGVFGVIGSLVSLAFYPRFKQNPFFLGLLAACLAQACEEAPKALIEPLNFAFYATPDAATLFSLVQLGSLGVFALLLGGKVSEKMGFGVRLQPS